MNVVNAGRIGLGIGAALGLACAAGQGTEDGAGVTGPSASTGAAASSGSTTGAAGSGTTGDSATTEQVDDTFGCPLMTYYPDVDEDGFGDDEYPVDACLPPPAHIPQGGDCDDTNPEVHPGVDEVCDGADNDCNGLFDEASATNPSCQGCGLGVEGGHAYYYCPGPLSWDEARGFCAQFGPADLVTVDDAAEHDLLLAAPLPAAPVFYLGLSDIETEGSFVWTDGTAPGFTAWGMGEPNDALEGEDCAQLAVATGVWNDIACATASAFICEASG
ncbi:MAG: lectin-like protein [Nannocystaceae bacterium]